MTQPIPPQVREQFEDFAYRHYQTARMSILFASGREALAEEDRDEALPRHEYTATDIKGSYKREVLNLLWVGWKLCLDAQAPTLEAANLWRLWAETQETAAETLPVDYEIEWLLDSKHSSEAGAGLVKVCVYDPDGCTLEFADPDDLDSPGLFARIVGKALEAAKADNATRLN